MRWRSMFALPALLASGCTPFAGYYYAPIYVPPAYPAGAAPSGPMAEGADCRPGSFQATIDGKLQTVTGLMCRGADGQYHFQPAGMPTGPAP